MGQGERARGDVGAAFVAGIPVVAPGAGPFTPGRARNRAVSVTHAVTTPVTDNPSESLCGVWVIATADVRWDQVWGAGRCQTCLGITG